MHGIHVNFSLRNAYKMHMKQVDFITAKCYLKFERMQFSYNLREGSSLLQRHQEQMSLNASYHTTNR